MIKIKRGLDLPIAGTPEQVIHNLPEVSSVALMGSCYLGMKPDMKVKLGDRVKCGQVLFTDKKNPGFNFTAPASGTVAAINRGQRRILQSVVIDIEGDDAEQFPTYDVADLERLDYTKIADNLLQSGMWTAFRTRPYNKIPVPHSQPRSIFVTAIDTHPLAPDPAVIIAQRKDDFVFGLDIIARLTTGKVFVCTAENATVPLSSTSDLAEFSGPHPAGLAGTHIHFLDPVNSKKTVWYIGYQDVIAIGQLFKSGQLFTERVIALAGPQVKQPCLLKTRLGAAVTDLIKNRLHEGEFSNRIISGSVLGGITAHGSYAYLDRYANQVSVLEEGYKREFFGWINPLGEKFSVYNVVAAKFLPFRKMNFTTSTRGSQRTMVPSGMFERVMPLDILPTQLLRAIVVGDMVSAQQLGCLELAAEDLALCTYACPGKYEYGPILNDLLLRIEAEG